MNPVGWILKKLQLQKVTTSYLSSFALVHADKQQKKGLTSSCFVKTIINSFQARQTHYSYYSISRRKLSYPLKSFNSFLVRPHSTINDAYGDHYSRKNGDRPYYAVPEENFAGTDYETEKEQFRIHVPEFYNFCTDIIDKWADVEKKSSEIEKLAFWWKDDKNEIKWTFSDLHRQSNQVANMLLNECGLLKGDRLIVILPRIPSWWLINLAAIRTGIILSPGTTQLRAGDIKHRLKLSGAKCIIADNSTRHLIDQVSEECPELQHKIYVGLKSDTGSSWLNFDELQVQQQETFQNIKTRSSDPMMWFFTSGTTGNPKMTEHTHASYGLGCSLVARYFLTARHSDIIWNISDTGWAKCAWSSFFSPWLAGACVFTYHTSSTKFQVENLLQILEDCSISVLCAPATLLRLVVQHDLTVRKFNALRHCVSAGEPLNPELIEKWKRDTHLELYEGFGQTETTLLCGNYPFMKQKVGSMGKPPPGIDLQIVDDEGNVLPPDTEGNIGVRYRPQRPVGLFSKYVNDPEKTASAFLGDFYLTGDKALMDKDGYLWFISRSDDVINSSGYRIGPFEVESALIKHPAVLESAVVSSPDPLRGEIVKAFVKLVPGYEKKNVQDLIKELQEHTKAITAPYKYPRKIEFVDELPKTVSGKIRRVELRNKEWNQMGN